MKANWRNRWRMPSPATPAGWSKWTALEHFIHVFNPPLKMIIVGAVHVSQALIPMAQATGYAVTIIDPRGAFSTRERFPDVSLYDDWPDDVLAGLEVDHRSAILALTHDPKIDDPALSFALKSPCFYIGALGSRKTHAGRRERLAANGFYRCGAGPDPWTYRSQYRRYRRCRDRRFDHGRGDADPATGAG